MNWVREFESKDYEFWQSGICSDENESYQYSNLRQFIFGEIRMTLVRLNVCWQP